ncbi:hypothetical protein SNEBB_003894 [Seison nebaliae]|nr:hypothetical protein SNEBB_003894 [Seison nebaliae]
MHKFKDKLNNRITKEDKSHYLIQSRWRITLYISVFLLWFLALVLIFCAAIFFVRKSSDFQPAEFELNKSFNHGYRFLGVLSIFTSLAFLSCSCVAYLGTIRDNRLLLNISGKVAITLIVILVLMFFITIGLHVSNERSILGKIDEDHIKRYYGEMDEKNDYHIDIIQHEYLCCGYESYESWEVNDYYKCPYRHLLQYSDDRILLPDNYTQYSQLACSLPKSCHRRCKDNCLPNDLLLRKKNSVILKELDTYVYTIGCKTVITSSRYRQLLTTGLFFLLWILIPLLHFFLVRHVVTIIFDREGEMLDAANAEILIGKNIEEL